ncbi:MAG TPA: hypothetical protein VK612_01220, partial [Pyrinomonadaceae bacterium]|nr:hypothetical protein [Pyrinomonadaceae bacterium]
TAVERLKRVEFQLAHDLLLWQEDLAERDAKIEAYHIRRYCDALKNPLDADVFVALSRFYRDLNRLSKFDLAMTRAFSTQKDELRRSVSLSRKDLNVRISDLFSRWDKKPVDDTSSPRDVQIFDRFVSEGIAIGDFQSLTSVRLFDRIREFKSELGDRFYDPSVVAAALECNIAVGNQLNVLMAKASESLGERLGSEFDFAGAFQDTSATAGTYISEVLRQIDAKDSLITADSESEDLKFIRSLLDLAATVRNGETEGEDEYAATVLSTSQPEFRNLVALLNQQNPNTKDLRKHLDASRSLRSLDLNDFLFLEDDSVDELSREVLQVILCLEEIRNNELLERTTISHAIRNEVMSLLARAEELGSKLTATFGSRQLLVANKLLETRLRIERSIVRFTSPTLHPGDKILGSDQEFVIDDRSTFTYVDVKATHANRWIVIATAAVAIISSILFFLSVGTSDASSMLSSGDVEVFEPSKMPGGKHLTSVHRQGSTLYVVGSKIWSGMSDEEKTGSVKDLAGIGSKTKIETVVVIDDQGQPLADLTPDGVKINKEEN